MDGRIDIANNIPAKIQGSIVRTKIQDTSSYIGP